jgi:hypothetical protein
LIYSGDKWYAQLVTGDWSPDGKVWIKEYANLKNVRVEGNKFYSDKSNGEFAIMIMIKSMLKD